jgi:hypothetical protein
MGVATRMAIFSALNSPNLLGSNSPKMMDKKVTITTIIIVETEAA